MMINKKISYCLKYTAPSPRKILNLVLVKFSKVFKLKRVLGYPLTVMVEPTNICNLKCPLCPTGQGLLRRPKGFLSLEDFKKIVDQFGDYSLHLRLWNWGEPLLNEELIEMIKYARRYRWYINTSTNSFFLTKDFAKEIVSSGLDSLIISLDGASEETYSKYRQHGNFKNVVDAISALVEEKKKQNSKTPKIHLQFIVMKHNEHEIPKIKELAKQLQVDFLALKKVGIMDPSMKDKIKEYLPSDRYAKYTKEAKIKTNRNMCNMIYEETIVNWDGSVVPCCYDMHNSFVCGNLLKEPFSKIWNNSRYVNFRRAILKNKSKIPMCANCAGTTEGVLV